jgi:opacity protein-like surface antigen
MKKISTLLAASAIAAAISAPAFAADLDPAIADEQAALTGLYLRADGGGSFLDWSGAPDKKGANLGGGIGYRFSDMMRTDLTFDWSGGYKVAPGVNWSSKTVLGNVYLDVPTGTAFTPYVGVGAGYSFRENAKDGAALAASAGVAVDLSQNIAVDVGYRYLHHVAKSARDPKEHQIRAGLRFSF